MPFELLPTIAQTKKQSMASISYRKFGTKHGRSKDPKLIVVISLAIANGFKPKEGATFEFHVGTGADVGKARIMPSKNGIRPTYFRHGFVFRFGFVPMLGQDQAEKEPCAAKMIGTDSFEIDLPPWFKKD